MTFSAETYPPTPSLASFDPNYPPFPGPIRITDDKIRTFYKGILLLKALSKVLPSLDEDNLGAQSGAAELIAPQDLEPEALFQSFVCRLAQICDSTPYGPTVTAFTVLELPDKVQFVFTPNDTGKVSLRITREYITAVLETLREVANEEYDEADRIEMTRGLLRDVLWYNRDRIRKYMAHFRGALAECVEICGNSNQKAVLSQKPRLEEILEIAEPLKDKTLSSSEYLNHVERVLRSLEYFQQKAVIGFVRRRTADSSTANTAPWRKLRHFKSRLLSYSRAIDTLWVAAETWPKLFDSFEVIALSSIREEDHPLKPVAAMKSSAILSRLLRGFDGEQRILELIEALEAGALDKMLVEQWDKPGYANVHCEVRLLNWLVNTPGGTQPRRFFNRWSFIGCSKQTCRLCEYYISNHPSGVKVRTGHGIVYPGWRLPDGPDVEGCRTEDDAVKRRHDMMQGVTKRVRQDILHMLEGSSNDAQNRDTATYSSLVNVPSRFGPIDGRSDAPSEIASTGTYETETDEHSVASED